MKRRIAIANGTLYGLQKHLSNNNIKLNNINNVKLKKQNTNKTCADKYS